MLVSKGGKEETQEGPGLVIAKARQKWNSH